jgi:tetratricopeptide (TPR) repeat protein
MKKYISILTIIYLGFAAPGCKKYLDEKPDVKLALPSTLADFQALLDNYPVINNSDPGSGEISADNYYLFDADYQALSTDYFRNMYTWQKSNLFMPQSNDWYYSYRPVFTANTILESLSKIAETGSNQHDYNNVKGEAFFIRGKAFLQVAGLWTSAYDPNVSSVQLGIPLRLSSDFNQQSVRSNLQETYNQIIADLRSAAALLPITPLHVMRSSKPAAFALLARTYLYIQQYEKAGLYADSCLQLAHTLLDYNTLNAGANYPIAQFNPEVIHENKIPVPAPLSNTRARIDTLLYNSYAANDLRKIILFKASANGTHVFKGSYEGGGNLFGGVAVDEVYLMRAECFARVGKTNEAMSDLNTLLTNRFRSGTFVPVMATNAKDALSLILTERRKELLMRGLRWMDLKRLNKEGANITLSRSINGQTYTLLPNDLRYALPIPDDIILLTGMQQNPR